MAFTNALSILQDKTNNTPATLQEIYGAVIDGVRKSTLSQTFKSNLYTEILLQVPYSLRGL